MDIIVDNTSKVIRGPFTHDEPVPSGFTKRAISDPEYITIDAIQRAGNVAVDDPGGIRAATFDEAEERKTIENAILDRIALLGSASNRASVYNLVPAILLAMKRNDKDGAKAVVDLATSIPLAGRNKIKALIDRAPVT